MERKLPSAGAIFLMLICTVLCVGAGFAVSIQAKRWNEFKLTAKPVTAVITQITTHRTGTRKNKKTSHNVYVSYNVDGNDYETKLSYYTSNMHKGGKVKLYYDPEDPSIAMSDPTISNIIISVIAGLIFIVIFAFFINEIRTCIKVNRLISEDKYYICDDWVEENASVTVNHVRYHQIKCRITDDRGREYTFVSPAFAPSKSPYKQGDLIKIYVDLFESADRYYISKYPI